MGISLHARQKHEEPAASADVKGAVEQRYTQAEINHFIARLETMRALGLDSYMTACMYYVVICMCLYVYIYIYVL